MLDHLLSPGRIGNLELRNRIAMAPMGVEIVEVYPGPASLPPEYNDPGTKCAIGIWTKRGG